MMPSVCSRLCRLCRLCMLCELCKLCRLLLDARLLLATGMLLLFNARLWRITELRIEVLGEWLLVDHCRVFLGKGVLVAADASSTGPALGVLKGIQSWGVTQASSFVPTLELWIWEAVERGCEA